MQQILFYMAKSLMAYNIYTQQRRNELVSNNNIDLKCVKLWLENWYSINTYNNEYNSMHIIMGVNGG